MDPRNSPQTSLVWEKQPFAELLRIAWPLMVSLVSVSIMSIVDTLFIGRVGATELAAAGLGAVSAFTVLSFGFAVFGAAKVKVSEGFGRGDHLGVSKSLGAFLRLALVLGALSTVVGLLVGFILPWVSADAETGKLAGEYASIRASGFLFVLLAAAIGQWLQAQGDSQSSMRAALVANVANVPLNALLIFGLGWGVAGAAWASAASQLAEFLWLARIQARKSLALPGGKRTNPGFHLGRAAWSDARRAFLVGLPSGLERVLDMIAFAAVPLLLSQLGPTHVAAHQIVLQVMLLSFLPLFALSEAVSVLIAQAVGAGRVGLVRGLWRLGLYVALGYAVIIGVVCSIAARPIIGIFSPDAGVIEVGAATLSVGALLQLLNAAYIQLKGALRGLSVFRYVAWVTISCAWVITPPLTYLIGVRAKHGAPGAWSVLCLEVTLGVALLAWRLQKQGRTEAG